MTRRLIVFEGSLEKGLPGIELNMNHKIVAIGPSCTCSCVTRRTAWPNTSDGLSDGRDASDSLLDVRNTGDCVLDVRDNFDSFLDHY